MAGFIDCGLQFFEGKLLRFRIASVRQYGATGESFDVVDAVVSKLTNNFANLPWTVGFSIAQIPGKLDVGGETGGCARAAGDGEVGAGDVHARANNVAAIDGIAQG